MGSLSALFCGGPVTLLPPTVGRMILPCTDAHFKEFHIRRSVVTSHCQPIIWGRCPVPVYSTLRLCSRSVCCWRVDRVRVITRLPSSLRCETAACTFADYVYVVGLGKSSDEVWRYRLRTCVLRGGGGRQDGGSTEWTLCARLATGRRRHCLATVGRQLYVLAGIASSDNSTVLDSVEVSIYRRCRSNSYQLPPPTRTWRLSVCLFANLLATSIGSL